MSRKQWRNNSDFFLYFIMKLSVVRFNFSDRIVIVLIIDFEKYGFQIITTNNYGMTILFCWKDWMGTVVHHWKLKRIVLFISFILDMVSGQIQLAKEKFAYNWKFNFLRIRWNNTTISCSQIYNANKNVIPISSSKALIIG